MTDLNNTIRVVDIVDGTTVDGPGFRTSIYFAGCSHHCPGCQNPQTWDAEAGRDMMFAEIIDRIVVNDFNVTFSGGDPLFQIDKLILLSKEIRRLGKSIWCYTGYEFEKLAADERFSRLLPYVEVVVDGRFDQAKRDISLLFRGSSNQHLVDVAHYLATGSIKEWQSEF